MRLVTPVSVMLGGDVARHSPRNGPGEFALRAVSHRRGVGAHLGDRGAVKGKERLLHQFA